MIYFSSDFHFYHKNLAKGSSTWEQGRQTRDFKDHFEMTDHIIDQINGTVGKDDTLYFLGDWSFSGVDSIWKARRRIKCTHIELVLGNHDSAIRDNRKLPNCKYEELVWSPLSSLEGEVQAQDLFKSCQPYKEISIEKQHIVLSHYSHRVWNRSHKGAWMLFGHSHDTLHFEHWKGDNRMINYFYSVYKTMDVGVDAAKRILGEYRPFSFEEIRDIMNTRKILTVDHHSNT